MKEVFEDLYNYNYHTNHSFIDALRKSENEKGLQLLGHLLNAHEIWLARIRKKTPAFEVWATHPINACDALNLSNFHQSQQLIKDLGTADYDTIVHYQTSKGDKYQNTIRDILLHIINHSTHHRAQIAFILRQQGNPPPISDYIFYKRDSN
jgi:uncharacterized damage-inducible protein DinB